MQIEHEVGQSPFQTRAQIPVHGKSRAGKFGRSLQIEHTELLPEFPVWLRGEIRLGRLTPASHFDVVLRSLAGGHTFVWQIRNALQYGQELLYVFLNARFKLLDDGFFVSDLA